MTFHALLIGVNHYFPNRLSNGGSYQPLAGAVNDVLRVEAMLKGRIRDRPPAITKLIGSQVAGTDESTWPTAANIRRALAELVERAQPGDQVLIQYCGHGGRVATSWPELKGEGTVDEALVPIDIGRAPGSSSIDTRPEHYIRDVELAYYLDRLAHKFDPKTKQRVTTTALLDSCHSGGATRGNSPFALRSASGGDGDTLDRRPAVRSAIADSERAAMIEVYRRLQSPNRPPRPAGAGWVPASDGYVVLAACRDVESAIECPIDGRGWSGVLTNALLEALERVDGTQSWRTVYDRVLARVHRLYPSQTPQLLGEIDRQVLGVVLTPSPHSFAVKRTDAARKQVTINAGLALNVTNGTELGIYRPGTTDFSLAESRVATATVSDARGLDATATLDDGSIPSVIEDGAPVIVESTPLRRQVELFRRDDLPAAIAARQDEILTTLREVIARDGRGFVEVAADGRMPHYQVALTPTGCFEVCDPRGVPLQYLEPIVRIDDPQGSAQVAAQLRRLCRYHAVLEMSEASPELWANLDVELLVPTPGWNPDQPAPTTGGTPLERTGDAYTVESDTWLWLRITNRRRDTPVNLALLNLSRKWEVEAVVPGANDPAGTKYKTVHEHPVTLAFQMYTPIAEAFDVLKLFVATGDVDFPRLATSTAATRAATRSTRSLNNALSRLIDMIDGEQLVVTREVRARSAAEPWSVRELRFRTIQKSVAATG